MAIKIASVSDTWAKDVFTDKGLYCGKVEDVECDMKRFKMRSLVVKAAKGSYLSKMLGDKKGIIIPFPMVEAMGDIIIIKHISTPIAEDTVETESLSKD
ncbi:MAG: PRC-barrel domain-containing protein [Candidatus Aenigmatarchaeota archaeon]|nr:PRC-barrel domain-containing protein [Nanoarchaeota archaeon]